MSTIITKRQFPNYHKYTMELAGRPLTLEVGKLAELANAAVMVAYGDTSVLCCVTAAARPRDGIDFFPLSVDFEEKLYAVGRIPGSFNRREGRPGEKGILTSRVIDRPIRPLFPSDFRNDVSVMCTVMSVDHDCSPEIAALIGTSAALAISDIPWNGPVGALKVGLVDGELVLNPNSEQRKVSDLDVTVVSTGKKVVMIEAGANRGGQRHHVPMPSSWPIRRTRSRWPSSTRWSPRSASPSSTIPTPTSTRSCSTRSSHDFMDEAKAAMDTDDKNVREARWNEMIEHWHEKYLEEYPDMDQYLEEFTYKFQKKIVKAWLLEGHRVDGRQKNEIRPLSAEVGVLPRVHGSGLFTRGQTQVLSVATLDTLSACQKLDTIWEETEKRYMHHYNFPGYSVGEAKPARSPGRREIGHGALAERALLPVIPPVEEFPYAIRVVSEVVSSNGSTSQGSICGSTPGSDGRRCAHQGPCGRHFLRPDPGRRRLLHHLHRHSGRGGLPRRDGLQGRRHQEGHHRHSDGPEERRPDHGDHQATLWTSPTMPGARSWTRSCCPASAEPRTEVSKYAPKMLTMHIDPDQASVRSSARAASVIQKIVADTGAKIDIDDDGTIHIASRRRREPATPPRSASTTSSLYRRWASCTTAVSCA